MIIVPITIGAIFFLLFMLFRSVRLAALIILVLPFASMGGVAAPILHRRISLRSRIGRIYRAMGHRGAEWSCAGLLHSKLATGGRGTAEAVMQGAKLRFGL